MIKMVISGAQTGADIAGISTAAKFGIKTGGTMPKGFKTLIGPKPDWAEKYGLKESDSPKYPPRTYDNVFNSDGTIRFASNFNSPGEKCTLKFINQCQKFYKDIDVMNPLPIEDVVKWINDNNIEILNVAGNSEKTCNGIGLEVENYLTELFQALGF